MLDAAHDVEPGERFRRYQTVCVPRGACQRELLTNDSGRWTWCADCLTVYDDYGRAVNRIPDLETRKPQLTHFGEAPSRGEYSDPTRPKRMN
jgi:hypothetical protein